MALSLNAPFVKHAADILADTTSGLSGGKIASECAAFAVEWGVDIPHATYPFGADVPNKRTALNQNLLKFSEPQRYAVIRALCDHDAVKDRDEVKKLKLMLISRYGHLANETIASDLDQQLIERTKHWLADFPAALALQRSRPEARQSAVSAQCSRRHAALARAPAQGGAGQREVA